MQRPFAAVCAAVVLVGCGGGDEQRSDCEGFRVDRAAWRAPDATDVPLDKATLSTRQEIAASIVECRALHRRSRGAVKATLGEPTFRGEDGWYWELGAQRELGGLDNEQLQLKFDRAGRVTGAKIVTF